MMKEIAQGESIMTSLETVFMIFILATAIFGVMKKRISCFLSSLVAFGAMLARCIIEQQPIASTFWALCILLDLYVYGNDHWSFFGYFDEEE